ncbi:hypothetical protein SEA_BUMBLE_45 [Arthrobacter phage Bumble]|uniref:Uncharacterized protein n=1 Tax=Arthrobacter phage Bumble TaxID=2743904 RepID=A0A7G3VAD0_9CAUD|nr:hypothetical protein SEA_BUMBLE_45 [Arthrobacter phage Bumble]
MTTQRLTTNEEEGRDATTAPRPASGALLPDLPLPGPLVGVDLARAGDWLLAPRLDRG